MENKRIIFLLLILTGMISTFSQKYYGNNFSSQMYSYFPCTDTLSEIGVILNLKNETYSVNEIGVNAQYFGSETPICRFNIYSVDGSNFEKKHTFELSSLPSPTDTTLAVPIESEVYISEKILISIVSLQGNKDEQYIEFPVKLSPIKPFYFRSNEGEWEKTKLVKFPIWIKLEKE